MFIFVLSCRLNMWPKQSVSYQASWFREDGWSLYSVWKQQGALWSTDCFTTSESSGMQLGTLSIRGRTPGFKWTRSFFSLFAKVCQCPVKSRSNLFDTRLVAEPHHPFLWESWPAVMLLCARALWGYWFCASATQWIREELPWAAGLQKRNSCLS